MGASEVRKGKDYERKIVNLLNSHAKTYKFRRRIVTGHGSSIVDVESVGDIISTNGKLRFVLEMKKVKGFSIESLLINAEKSKFYTWWKQITNDIIISKNAELLPMLFFKSKSNDMVAICEHGMKKLNLDVVGGIVGIAVYNAFPSFPRPIYIFDLKQFLGKCDVDTLCLPSS